MKIGVIGATGHAGSAIVNEALSRGHQVTAIVRNAAKAEKMFGDKVTVIQKDAMAITKADLTPFDVVVDSFATRDAAYRHLDLATRLVSELRGDDHTRVFFILGASSLLDHGKRVIDQVLAANKGADWVQTPQQQWHEYQFLQWVDNVNWTAMSPQFEFKVGPRSAYQLGKDELLHNNEGKSTVTTGNFAAAMLDEIEHPNHIRSRFTVCDQ